MANWIPNVYSSLDAAATAIALIDNTTTIHVTAFSEGGLQKVLVVKSV